MQSTTNWRNQVPIWDGDYRLIKSAETSGMPAVPFRSRKPGVSIHTKGMLLHNHSSNFEWFDININTNPVFNLSAPGDLIISVDVAVVTSGWASRAAGPSSARGVTQPHAPRQKVADVSGQPRAQAGERVGCLSNGRCRTSLRR